MKEPRSTSVKRGPYRVKDRAAHKALLSKAREEHLYVWIADVRTDGNGISRAVEPHIIDWESLPDHLNSADEQTTTNGDVVYKCGCGKICTSKPGLTLHQQKCDQTTDIKTPVQNTTGYTCACGKVCSSQSGLTLHQQRCKGA